MAKYYGVIVDISSTIDEAMQLCKTNTYDIALTDWNLKGETGLDYISTIKTKSYCPNFIVICSAYSKHYIEAHSTLDSTIHYLPKPITLKSFNQLLNRYINPDKTPDLLTLDKSTEKSIVDTTSVKKEEVKKDQQKILLVEDNKINQIVATKLLESLGLSVDVAQDGYEAIECIEKHHYPVVLMDIQMPKMDGITATRKLRETIFEDQLRIIALTANVTQEEVDYYVSIGMNGHLGKPYEIDKIREMLSGTYQLQQVVE